MPQADSNPDYQLIASAVTVLRNQLQQAELDVLRLTELKEKALADPTAFLAQLLSKDLRREHIPSLQRVVAIPEVDLTKYGVSGPSHNEFRPAKRARRVSVFRQINHNSLFQAVPSRTSSSNALYASAPDFVDDTVCDVQATLSADISAKPPLQPQPPASTSQSQTASSTPPAPLLQAAPPVTATPPSKLGPAEPPPPSKPQYNQSLWSDSENRRLLELLDEIPAESTIAGRAEKISRLLGTRSPIQIANRLNKLIGSDGRSSLRKSLSLQQRLANSSKRTSGVHYLGSSQAPVQMSDDSDSDSDSRFDPSVRETDQYKELRKLKRLAKLKSREQASASTKIGPIHRSYSCDSCSMSPIVGIRWKCKDCPADAQIDLCEDCVVKGFENGSHSALHTLERIEKPENPWDEGIESVKSY
ncbi:hypothetical protein DFJ73DRAFT_825719 [Zopfochytrium polystomum]|nr:hypothetical protein DFJ73DRAFT_825719 [Zopfochytrium polystomum]